MRHGAQLDYYPSGHPMSRARFRDGVQEGRLVAWYPDGVKQVEGDYRRGLAEVPAHSAPVDVASGR